MITKVRILDTEILSDNWYLLKRITYEFEQKGTMHTQSREAYDRGNGAAILLYNTEHRTVILTRQFRLPAFINGSEDGMLIEVCAGLLDKDHPEDCIRRETEEETGYRIRDVRRVYEMYMSPGSVTEILYFFIAEYDHSMKLHEGGGIAEEQENIEVLEIPIDEALLMIDKGSIRDAKSIILLQHIRLKGIL